MWILLFVLNVDLLICIRCRSSYFIRCGSPYGIRCGLYYLCWMWISLFVLGKDLSICIRCGFLILVCTSYSYVCLAKFVNMSGFLYYLNLSVVVFIVVLCLRLYSTNSPCSKRRENWVRVRTAKHLWIDWMDRGSILSNCHIVYEPAVHLINP